jgi:hypothetical protein
MSRAFSVLCASLYACSLTNASADEVFASQEIAPLFQEEITAPTPVEAPIAQPIVQQAPPAVMVPPPAPKVEVPFKPFTGRVKRSKVRLRLNANLESAIVKELHKSELLSVVGEKGGFWMVEPPLGVKTYVFRGLVLDNVVEANRVNIRIEPSLEGAVVGHLNVGDKVDGTVCAANSKWLEINPPAKTQFYVAKEYLEHAGGPEFKAQADKRRLQAEQLLGAATILSTAELRKPFEEIDSDKMARNYNAILSDYAEFPEYVEQAKEALASFQEAFIQKRIHFLETQEEDVTVAAEHKGSQKKESSTESATDKMKLWEPIEEALYLSWARVNSDRDLKQFYEDQKLNAVAITGILEAYNAPVKNKPGDYILRDKDLPLSYVYSTQVNLQALVGKRVTLIGTQRPNNNFAFPAYFVLAAE